MNEFSNADLTIEDIPKPEDGWGKFSGFALIFNGYDFHDGFEACGEITNHWLKIYKNDGNLPPNLADLRTCLFFEQRRWRHYGFNHGEDAMDYVRALVSGIRTNVKNQNLDTSID